MSLIERMQKKSIHERRLAALGVAVVGTLVIGVFWVGTFKARISPISNTDSVNIVETERSGLPGAQSADGLLSSEEEGDTIGSATGAQTEAVKSLLGTAVEAVTGIFERPVQYESGDQ